jgi:hypothetical protein
MTVIGVIAQGTMGSGVGRRCAKAGRKSAPCCRAQPARPTVREPPAWLPRRRTRSAEGADFFLSILPPGTPSRRWRDPGSTRPQTGLYRLQRGQPADRDPHWRSHNANRHPFRRWWDHRRTAAPRL